MWGPFCRQHVEQTNYHIEAKTMWAPFCRQHVETHLFNEKYPISVIISLKFAIMSTFVQIMAWPRTGDKPITGSIMANFTVACMHHSASMSYKCPRSVVRGPFYQHGYTDIKAWIRNHTLAFTWDVIIHPMP